MQSQGQRLLYRQPFGGGYVQAVLPQKVEKCIKHDRSPLLVSTFKLKLILAEMTTQCKGTGREFQLNRQFFTSSPFSACSNPCTVKGYRGNMAEMMS